MWWRNEDPTQTKVDANSGALEHPVTSAHALLWCQNPLSLPKPAGICDPIRKDLI